MSRAIRVFIILAFLTGVIYPALITFIAYFTMHHKATGSMILSKENIVGSLHIGQKFESEKYFWPRPSAVTYNPLPSGGSNLSQTSSKLKEQVENRKQRILKTNPTEPIPSELVYASASGLDPEISPKTAYFQIPRIANARKLDPEKTEQMKQLIDQLTTPPRFHFLGQPTVNVLRLNLAVDKFFEEEGKNELRTKTKS